MLTRSITENAVKLTIREIIYAEIDQSDRHYTRTGLKTEEVGEEMTEVQLTLSREAASVHIWHVVDVYHRRIRSHHSIGRAQKETRVVSEGIRAGRGKAASSLGEVHRSRSNGPVEIVCTVLARLVFARRT